MSRSPEASDATPLADTVRDISHARDQTEEIRKAEINSTRRLYFARGLGVVLEHLNFEEEKTVPREITPYLRRLGDYVKGLSHRSRSPDCRRRGWSLSLKPRRC